jgi:hypothetical protein
MSLAAFKKKSVILYGANVSGKPTGGDDMWVHRGPFGRTNQVLSSGNNGFSINGGTRNVGYVGKTYAMSKQGTRYRGLHAIGYGGHGGQYYHAEPVLNSAEVHTLGQQAEFIKPSVLSTPGMLRTRYRWLYNGVYPNWIVKNIYTGNMTANASEGLYIDRLSSANDCVFDVNNQEKYAATCTKDGLCSDRMSIVKRTYNNVAMDAPYTKPAKCAVSQSDYMLRLTKKCSRGVPHYPEATNGNNACVYGCGSV